MKQRFSITVHQPRTTRERRTNEENRKIALTYSQEFPGHSTGRNNPGRARQFRRAGQMEGGVQIGQN